MRPSEKTTEVQTESNPRRTGVVSRLSNASSLAPIPKPIPPPGPLLSKRPLPPAAPTEIKKSWTRRKVCWNRPTQKAAPRANIALTFAVHREFRWETADR
jgi:hypothetical protein